MVKFYSLLRDALFRDPRHPNFPHPLTIAGLSAFSGIASYALIEILLGESFLKSSLLVLLGSSLFIALIPRIFFRLRPPPVPLNLHKREGEELNLDILHAIEDGIIIVGEHEQVLFFNRSAESFLAPMMHTPWNTAPQGEGHQPLQLKLSEPALAAAIHSALLKREKEILEFRLPGKERVLQAYLTPISLPLPIQEISLAPPMDLKRKAGVIVLLHDITQFKKLESLRKEFVANVSHELKTPITSIKGFVETLLDGALDDRFDTERFLGIISRQADRLSTIIEDLLSLSRLEQDGYNQEIKRDKIHLHDLVERAVQGCILKADEKKIILIRDLPRSIELFVNPPLIEQALLNLLDNGIKYSKERSLVQIFAECNGPDITIKISDGGIGIPEADLPRIFERFYRVDRARSRSLGGTGLGLSIVKHIAQAHGGRVEVQSTPERGSIFSLILPNALVGERKGLVPEVIRSESLISSTPEAPQELPPALKAREPTRVVENI